MSEEQSPFDRFKPAVGLLVGAFGAAVGFIGISQGEVTEIIRNQGWQPAFVAFVLAVALGFCAVSAFVADRDISPWLATGLVLAACDMLVITAVALPIGSKLVGVGWAVSTLLGLAAVALIVFGTVDTVTHPDHRIWSAQPATIICAVVLLVVAIFGGLRLETRSQYLGSGALVTSSLTTVDGTRVVNLEVKVSKLRAEDTVLISVDDTDLSGDPCFGNLDAVPSTTTSTGAAPRSAPLGLANPTTCLARAELAPGPDGSVDETIQVPLDPHRHALVIQANPCVRKLSGGVQPCRTHPSTLLLNVPAEATTTTG